ncbi:MAG: hypothetical protein HY900_08405, partial [Deltaproteobacteria bacterium]|nr:hypothetical protein [Deltaproteobacteria bacterium]
TGCGGTLSGNTYTTGPITATCTVAATFAVNTYSVTPWAGAGGSLNPATAQTVTYNSTASFTVTPSAGYHVASITGCGGTLSGITYTTGPITGDCTVTAAFAADSGTNYIVTASAEAGGTISPSGATTVSAGGTQTYTFTPDTGYEVHDVVVNFFSQGPMASYIFENVQADQTISVRFAPIMVTVTASSNGGGTIGPGGAREYVYGSTVEYQITPAPGHHIADLLVDGASQGAPASYTFSNITAAHTIQAVFAENARWTISASSTGSGSVTPPGDTSVLEGLSQSYTFTPAAGWRVGSVLVDGLDRGVQTSWSFANVTANHTLVVNFVPDTLNITASALAGGTIAPNGITTLPRGGAQAYTFTPATGYKVQDVVVNFFSQGALPNYTFSNVQADQTISVSFSQLTYTVTASANTGGTIGPSGVREYVYGSTPSYSITPAPGYNLTDVLVDGVSAGAVTSYTFPSLTASHTIQAVFTVKPSYTITVSSTGSGTVTPGTTTVVEGLTKSFTFTPAAGWRVGSVIVDGADKGVQTSWSFSNVTADHTLTVNFINGYTINASAGANGSISPTGATSVAKGGSQTFTFTPAPGYKVRNVLVNFLSKGALPSYTFTNVQADQTISVSFTQITYPITATAGANGTIGPSGTRDYVQGASATYYVTPQPGYKIADVLVDGASVGPVASYPFTDITAAHTISATFALK